MTTFTTTKHWDGWTFSTNRDGEYQEPERKLVDLHAFDNEHTGRYAVMDLSDRYVYTANFQHCWQARDFAEEKALDGYAVDRRYAVIYIDEVAEVHASPTVQFRSELK